MTYLSRSLLAAVEAGVLSGAQPAATRPRCKLLAVARLPPRVSLAAVDALGNR
jgi:hypothetical protein